MMNRNGKLLEIRGLKKYFPLVKGLSRRTVGLVRAVDGVSFHIDRGEVLGLVGESGCGKSTLGRCVLGLLKPTEGRIFFDGRDISSMDAAETTEFRREAQAIFQDPYSSLNPRMTVAEIVGEPLAVHSVGNTRERRDRVGELLDKVGLGPQSLPRHPHEFSGGQRQRIGIARALALRPSLIVCDEPVSALDVSVQAQVINLLDDLRAEFRLSYLFIAHDLSLVEHICDRIAIMYLGKIVELVRDVELYSGSAHPYTKALMSSVPLPDPKRRGGKTILRGEVPSPVSPPAGCSFHPRCPVKVDICSLEEPDLRSIGPDHQAACHLV